MHRLLIVDDEPEIVNWLCELFEDCTSFDLDIYRAYSADEALSWLNRAKIDILLTDIHMPGMTGLQLARLTHKNWPKCRVIFLTGYNDFDNIYNAMKDECTSYLLKTEDDAEIITAVEKALSCIEKELDLEATSDRTRQHLDLAIPLLQNRYLSSMLEGSVRPKEVNQARMDELGIQLQATGRLILLLGRIDQEPEDASYLQISQFEFGLESILQQFLPQELKSSFVVVRQNSLVWVLQLRESSKIPEGDQENSNDWDRQIMLVRGSLESVQAACVGTLGVTASFILSVLPIHLADIAEEYTLLRQQLHSRMFRGEGIILTGGSRLVPGIASDQPDSSNRWLAQGVKRVERLEALLERGERKEFLELLSNLTLGMRGVRNMNHPPAIQSFYTLSVMLLGYINQTGQIKELESSLQLHRLTRLDTFGNWNEAVDYLFSLSQSIFNLQDSEQDHQVRDVITRVRDFIDSNLDKDVSLVKLAEYAYFNPSYLSRLFKKTTGENLSDYINEARCRRAKKLLKNSGMKIHEIAASVGFDTPQYFARFFNKHTGMTPQEFRQHEMP